MSTIKVHVTKDHINNSMQLQPEACMVWDALQAPLDLPDNVRVRVGYTSIGFHKKGPRGGLQKQSFSAPIPHEIGQKIKQWDRLKGSVDPFDFDLNLPDDWREKLNG